MASISVIIPAYNAEKTILETIQSVQDQTFSDFEIIVINDGSTDKTLALLDTVSEPRLKVFSYPNGGVSTARNRGISQAVGEFISFIDADDLWTPDKLESQIEALQRSPEAGVAYSWTTFIDEVGKPLYSRRPVFHEGNVYPQMLVECFLSNGSNILARKQFVEATGGFDPALSPVADWDFYIRLAALCPFVLVPKHQILYRQFAQSMTSKVSKMERETLLVLERAFLAAPPELQPIKKQSLGSAYHFFANLYLTHERNSQGVIQASQKLAQAIQFHPKLLLDKKVRRLVFKLTLLRLFPYELAVKFSRTIGKLLPDLSTRLLLLALSMWLLRRA